MTFELEDYERELYILHHGLAFRQNASSETIRAGKQLELSWPQALALALNTLGGAHAPLRQTYALLSAPSFADALDALPGKVPGWGSSWYKGERDPSIDKYECKVFTPTMRNYLDQLTTHVQIATGQDLYTNAAGVTAMTAIVAGQSVEWAEQIFVSARMPVWKEIYNGNCNPA